jgi:hypothetical protein
MENPTEKKPFPWVWVAVGCGAVAFVLLACAAVAAVAFVSLPAIRTALANQSPAIVQQVVPKIGSAPNLNPTTVPNPGLQPKTNPTTVPNTGSGNGNSTGNLPFKFSAIQDPAALSSQTLMDQMVTTLNLNNDSDFMAPKTYKGTITLDPTQGFTLGNGWCAKDSTTLKQNMADIQYQFSINGTPIDLSKYPTLDITDQQGHACAMTGLEIAQNGNLSGTYHVVLTQKFLKQLDDGITSSPYPAGDITFDFNVQFQSTPIPGTNS